MQSLVLTFPGVANLPVIQTAIAHSNHVTVIGDREMLGYAAALGAHQLIHARSSYADLSAFNDVDLIFTPHRWAAPSPPHNLWKGAYIGRVCDVALDGEMLRVVQRLPGKRRVYKVRPPVFLSLLPQSVAVPFVIPHPVSSVEDLTIPYLSNTAQKKPAKTFYDIEQATAFLYTHIEPYRDEPILQGEAVQLVEVMPDNTPLSLNAAPLIVAGGKGLAYHDAADAFVARVRYAFDHLITPLAGFWGGAVAASRAVIDAAGISSHYLVGQSGQRVSPAVYLAAGISGQPQHLQAIEHADMIIAINPDEDAPIHRIAHVSIYADAFAILSALLNRYRT